MRKTASRLIAAGLTVAALTLGLTASAVTTASATVTATRAPTALATACHDASCHGRDPVIWGCLPSTSTVENANSFVAVWNDYSGSCDANWGQAQLTPQSVRNHYSMLLETKTTDSDGHREFMCVPSLSNNVGALTELCDDGTDFSGGVAYTDMVDGTNVATVCALVYSNPNNPPIDQVCASQ
jgi:hypothetical protein